MNNTLKNRLKYHITGAIERGEAQAIVEIPPLHKGPFPLHITQNEDHSVIITSQGTHYAKTFDPSAARLISSAPDLLSALDWALRQIEDDLDPDHQAAFDAANSTLRKAKGEA